MNREAVEKRRIFTKVSREFLPKARDKHPFLYLEYGRLEIDDSSVKWVNSEGDVVRLPVAMVNCLLLGPGTSVTHEAIRILGASNCYVCWVGEDGLIFHSHGQSPTSNTRNLLKQVKVHASQKKSLAAARFLFSKRFPSADLNDKNLKEMMGMEGYRVRAIYEEYAEKYQVGWKGRNYKPGKFEFGDLTNRILTASNAALYGIISSVVHSMGYSPHIGFIHSGSPLPFVYDLSDLYKDKLTIELAFQMTLEMAGGYNRQIMSNEFRKKVVDMDLLGKVANDIEEVLGV